MSPPVGGPPTPWVAGCVAAQAVLDAALVGLDDATARPSLLPGWSVGHVLTHIARNAESVVWRLEGAARGELQDQYPGGLEQRTADIEGGAARTAEALADDVRQTSAAVELVMAELPPRPGRPVADVAAWWRARGRGLVPLA